jgi:hypothetical protein
MAVQAVEIPKMVDEQSASDLIGVKVKTLQDWRLKRNFGPPFIRVGGKLIRYRVDALLAWLEENTVTPSVD